MRPSIKIATAGLCLALAAGATLGLADPTESVVQVDETVRGNSDFAANMFRYLADEADGNVFFSPYSVSVALGMTYAGASGSTQSEMADVLRFGAAGDIHAALAEIQHIIQQQADATTGADAFALNVVNQIWLHEDTEFLPAFVELLAAQYDAEAKLVDFVDATEETREAINAWVAEQTEDRIHDLLPPGSLTMATRAVLTNAIYFHASWLSQFEEYNTYDAAFTLSDGSRASVPTMHQDSYYSYAQTDDYQAVEMVYEGGTTSMVIMVPRSGGLDELLASLDGDSLTDLPSSMSSEYLRLALPRFRTESKFSLKDALVALGMPTAFTPGAADFTRMTINASLYIDNVYHNSFVEVDETGTEAAAATAVVMNDEGAIFEPEAIELNIDQPFLFYVRDINTGSVLFMGRITDPRG